MNVYEAANERIAYTFNHFDNIYIAFSGGKDSGVLINLYIDYIRKHNLKRKIVVYHMDYEGQYQHTQDYLEQVMTSNSDIIDLYWVCLPLKTKCGCSMYDNFWLPWDPAKKDIWVRDLPKFNGVYTLDNHEFDFYRFGMEDVDFDTLFTGWLHRKYKAKKTIGLLGIRTQESLNRWRAINKKVNIYDNKRWVTPQKVKNTYMGYPIHDWKVEDIWIANYKFNWSYNKLYDLYHKAGLTISQMRVASAFIDEGVSNLNLHRVIDPDGWSKLVGRVNGANFGAIYGGTKAHGYRNVSLPNGHTWKSYCDFLLSTMPAETQNVYKKKFESTFKVWLTKGATVHKDCIPYLEKTNYKFEVVGQPKGVYYDNRDDIVLIKFKEYPDEMDGRFFNSLPSYKRVCITILKNDISCKYMGYGQTKYEREIRQLAMDKYKKL